MALNNKPISASIFGNDNIDDYLVGTSDNDTLSGGSSNINYSTNTDSNTLQGGFGDDVYIINSTADIVIEDAGDGIDTIYTTVNYSLPNNVENIASVGSTGLVLTGNAADNRLDGLQNTGSDTLIGSAGNDSYFIDASDKIIESTGTKDSGGIDTIITANSLDISANSLAITGAVFIENIILTGNTQVNATGNNLANKLIGNSAANNLSGNTGSDTLDGGVGADTLVGGAGDDFYVVDNNADSISENAKAGTDTVIASINWTLGDNLENLRLSANARNGTGNSLSNFITGNGFANNLVGNDGNDYLVGGNGNDTLDAGNGNDTLDGGVGTDNLIGAIGDDTYLISNTTDSIIENSNAGNDSVLASVNYVLADNLENLTLVGNAAINGTGNSMNNTITGNDAANNLMGNEGDDTLNGALGNDTLNGGLGNDTYIISDSSETINEADNAGSDTVQAAINFTLGNNLENLVLINTVTTGTGNSLDNTLTGNNAANNLIGNDGNDYLIGGSANDNEDGGMGNDTLDGGLGKDSLSGGLGDDTYLIDNASDVITEANNAGNDTVQTAINNLSLGNNLENLILTGSVANGTGNSLNNTLIGNSALNNLVGNEGDDNLVGAAGNDSLSGGTGNDTITGGVGKDTISTGAGNDVVTFAAGTTDTLATVKSVAGVDLYNDLNLNGGLADRLQLTVPVANTGGTVSGFLNENIFVTTMNALLNVGGGNGFQADTVGTITAAVVNATAGTLAGRSFLAVDLDGSDTFTASDFVIEITGSTLASLTSASFVGSVATIDNPPTGTANAVLALGTEDTVYTLKSSDLLQGITDTDGDKLSVSNLSATHGALLDNLNGTWNFIPDANYNGAVALNYSVSDGRGGTLAATQSFNLSPVNDLPTGAVSVSGNAMVGQTLTATNTLVDADGLGVISYSWQASGVTIAGATSNTYTPTGTDIGKTISAIARYSDTGGTVETVSSAATGTVVNANSAGFNISPTTTPITGENGATASYAVSLNTAPLAGQDVTLSFSSSDTTEGVIDNPTLTFNSTNWFTAQTLSMRGVNDYENDGNVPYLVTATVSTIDVFYKTLSVTPLSMTNLDDSRDIPLTIYGDVGGTKSDVLTGLDGNDVLYGLNMADNLSGGIGNDTLYGGYGGDNLFGNEGNDYLWGEQDNDYLDGGAGSDTLDGGTGADTMIGGAGNDTYYLSYDATDVIQDNGLPSDVDTVIMPYQMSSYTLPTGIENGTIADGTQASNLSGNDSDNSLIGNGGNNTLGGGLGRDSLFGGVGDDVLDGGTGNDALTGGAGNDVFQLDTALNANIDTITDFNVVNDTIQLSSSLFTNLALGTLATNSFVIDTAANANRAQIIYNNTTGAVYFDDDGLGSHAAMQILTIGVNLALTNADFVVA